jgi:soluble lytic murein transglycosylase-like protein
LFARRFALPLIAAAATAAVVGAPALGDGQPFADPMVEGLRQQFVKEKQQWDRARQRLIAANRRLRAENRRLRAAMSKGGVTAPSAHLRAIAACESGGDPDAVSGGGLYRGKYQFDMRTWHSVGGRGDPADAPEIEQDWRAFLLYEQRGAQPWPVCG